MHKRKHGPRLFELLAENRNEVAATLEVPRWWSRGRRTRKPPPYGEAADNSAGDAEMASPAPARAVAGTESFFELGGERIRLSFTSTTAAVAVFIAAVVLLASFELGSRLGHGRGLKTGYEAGRASYAAEAASEIEVARAQPPATHLVSRLLEDPAPAEVPGEANRERKNARVPQTPGWIRDYTYIVAQEFTAGRLDDARQAREYLAEHGIPTAFIRGSGGGAVQLITEQGYNHGDPTQKRIAEELLKRIHDAGASYYAQGGGYKLKGYYKTLKSDTW